jgi:hypothetical protein
VSDSFRTKEKGICAKVENWRGCGGQPRETNETGYYKGIWYYYYCTIIESVQEIFTAQAFQPRRARIFLTQSVRENLLHSGKVASDLV